jgi:FAD-linked sulfhydryl oxidase
MNGMAPPLAVAGPRGWERLHLAAIYFPENPSADDRRRAAMAIVGVVNGLPCPRCVGHATAYIRKHPPPLDDTHSFQTWVFTFHNAVNARLGKKVISFNEYQDKYYDDISLARAHDFSL